MIQNKRTWCLAAAYVTAGYQCWYFRFSGKYRKCSILNTENFSYNKVDNTEKKSITISTLHTSEIELMPNL